MRPRDTMLRLHRFRTEREAPAGCRHRGMINDFMRKYDDLDAAVKFEESRNGVSDPNHFNYSLQAKAARARRDNLMKSIAELKDQLTDAKSALDEDRAGTSPRRTPCREGRRQRRRRRGASHGGAPTRQVRR